MNSESQNKKNEAGKLIPAITEYIPTFFAPMCLLAREKEEEKNLNITEIISQCELFFSDHPNSFTSEESKSSYLIHKLSGPPKNGVCLLNLIGL